MKTDMRLGTQETSASFVHAFVQQMFIEYRLGARYSAKCSGRRECPGVSIRCFSRGICEALRGEKGGRKTFLEVF